MKYQLYPHHKPRQAHYCPQYNREVRFFFTRVLPGVITLLLALIAAFASKLGPLFAAIDAVHPAWWLALTVVVCGGLGYRWRRS